MVQYSNLNALLNHVKVCDIMKQTASASRFRKTFPICAVKQVTTISFAPRDSFFTPVWLSCQYPYVASETASCVA